MSKLAAGSEAAHQLLGLAMSKLAAHNYSYNFEMFFQIKLGEN